MAGYENCEKFIRRIYGENGPFYMPSCDGTDPIGRQCEYRNECPLSQYYILVDEIISRPPEITEQMEKAAAKVVNGERITETESVKLDLMFAMAMADGNGDPVVIKYETAEKIRKILQWVQDQEEKE